MREIVRRREVYRCVILFDSVTILEISHIHVRIGPNDCCDLSSLASTLMLLYSMATSPKYGFLYLNKDSGQAYLN